MCCVRSTLEPRCPKALKLSLLLPFTQKKSTTIMHSSERVQWTSAACFSLGGVDNCFQLSRYLLGRKKVTKFLSSFKTFHFVGATAVGPSHWSNLTESPGGSVSEGCVQADQSDLVSLACHRPAVSHCRTWLNRKAFRAVAVLCHCWV